jgi:hypothetical protein
MLHHCFHFAAAPNTRLIALVIDSDHQAAIEGRGVIDRVFADNSLTKNTVNSAEKCVI